MEKAKKETIKTSVMLAIIFALMGLCTFMGIQAITNNQSTKFNLGVVYGANYAVVVEMKTGAGENDFITIFDSTNPANINTAYIQSISNDTIRLNPEHLYLTGSTGIATFRVTAKEDTSSGGTNLQCGLNCGGYEYITQFLKKDEPVFANIATGLDASVSQPNAIELGNLRINLKIERVQEYYKIEKMIYDEEGQKASYYTEIYDSRYPAINDYVLNFNEDIISLNTELIGGSIYNYYFIIYNGD